MIDNLLSDLGGFGLVGLCLLAAGLAFGETAMFMDLIVPGEVGMVIVGAAAAEGHVAIAPVILAGAVGAIAGDGLSYALGRRWGRSIIDRFAVTRRRVGPLVDEAERHFAEHGGRSVFFGRFVGALRAVVPFVAGMGHLRVRTFLAWNVLASVLWAGGVITLGAVVGRSIADQVDRVGTVISVVVLVGIAIWFWRRRRRHSSVPEP